MDTPRAAEEFLNSSSEIVQFRRADPSYMNVIGLGPFM